MEQEQGKGRNVVFARPEERDGAGRGGKTRQGREERWWAGGQAGAKERAHLDEQREARVDRALQDAVAGGPHIQCVSPALCHSAHRAKVLGNLGGRMRRRADTQRGGAGTDMLGEDRSPHLRRTSSPPHLHLLQLAVVRTPEDHPPIAAASRHQRPVPQGAEPKYATIMGAQHHLCDAVSTYRVGRGRGEHVEASPILTPENTSHSQPYTQPFTTFPSIHPSTHLFK